MSNRELLALSSVELRRRVGTKEDLTGRIARSLLRRIEEINPRSTP